MRKYLNIAYNIYMNEYLDKYKYLIFFNYIFSKHIYKIMYAYSNLLFLLYKNYLIF